MMKKKILYPLSFLIKGWEVSLLLVLPILQSQGKISIFGVGIFASVFTVFQIFSSFLSGSLAEKFSRKAVMTAALFFYGLCWLLLLVPLNNFLLFTLYALGGMGTGSFIPLANSQIARISEKNRAKEMGDFSAFTDIGRIVLSWLTTFIIGTFGITLTGLVFGVLGIVSAAVLFGAKITHDLEKNTMPISVKLMDLLGIKRFIFAVLTGVFDVFASSSLFIFIPLLLIPKGIDISSIGFFTALFFAGYLAGRVFLGRLADKFGAVKILAFSQIFMAFLIISLLLTANFIAVGIILFSLGVFTRGTSPVIRAMMADSVKDADKFDKAFSLHSFTLSTSQVASRSAFGFLAGAFGIMSVFALSALAALGTLLPLYLYSKDKQSLRPPA